MPVDDAPEDDQVRETYNLAPGNHGLVYRADVPDYGAARRHQRQEQATETVTSNDDIDTDTGPIENPQQTKYKLQPMKWGACCLLLKFTDQCGG